jgi:hypothetical protein
MSQFAEPASPTGIEWATLNGALLVVEPIEIVTGINTNFGTTDAVRANVTVIDGEHAGTRYDDTLVFPKVLQSQLTSRIGQKVLGRLGQGQAKPGQSPPWMLKPGTPEESQLAVEFLARTQLTAADLVGDGTEPF